MGLGGYFRILLPFFPLQRFASLSRFVETLVVADDKMVAFHGAGLKRYLLTVMAAAAKAFKHPSIRNPVNLVVTRLVILGPGEEGPQVGPSATTRAGAGPRRAGRGTDGAIPGPGA